MTFRQKIIACLLIGINLSFFVFLITGNGVFEYTTSIELPFEVDEERDKLIVYCGFVGCPTICPESLGKLSKFEKQTQDPKMQIAFINLIDDLEEEVVNDYAKSYSSKFIGIQLDRQKKDYIIHKFNAFYSKKQALVNRETAHSNYVYFLTRNIGKTDNKWTLQYVVDPSNTENLKSTYTKILS